jgi:eukaryotic-like serine/threonine-protein kinase
VQRTRFDNRYTLGDLLGSGGMGEVYLAHDDLLERDVALKVLKEQYLDSEEFVRRFRREAKSAASLNHPHIARVYDWHRSEEGVYYMVMEYIPGGTLKDRLRNEGPLDPYSAAELAAQVALALGYAHERGVIHRDVKPHNILLTERGYAKVTDFGIAWAASATTTSSWSGLFSGTATYISPEQAMGKAVDPRSDLYSLGVVLYEMLTGTRPYSGEDPASIVFQHVNEPTRSPREANPAIPEPLDALTTKLLAKDREERYANGFELAEELKRIRSMLPSPVASNDKKTGKVTALRPSTEEEQTKRTASQQLAVASMRVFKGGGRGRGIMLVVLGTLVLGVIMLDVFVRLFT